MGEVSAGSLQLQLWGVSNLSIDGGSIKPRAYYVSVKVGKEVEQTAQFTNQPLHFGGATLTFNVPASSGAVSAELTLFRHRTFHADSVVGTCMIPFASVQGAEAGAPVHLECQLHSNAGLLATVVAVDLTFTPANAVESLRAQVNKAGEAASKAEPNLNLALTLPLNMHHFLIKATPVFKAIVAFKRILEWDNVVHSLLCLLTYCFLVWNSWLLPFLPFVLPLLFIASTFIHTLRTGEPYPPIECPYQEATVGLRQRESNMRDIQNQMGVYCEAVDAAYAAADLLFTWRRPPVTKAVLGGSVFGLVLVAIVPTRILLMIGGAAGLVSQTALAKGSLVYITHQVQWHLALIQNHQTVVKKVVGNERVRLQGSDGIVGEAASEGSLGTNLYSAVAAALTSGTDVSADTRPTKIVIKVFQNQRWWLGSGWSSKALERPEYMDLDGNESIPRQAFAEPEGYRWDGEWALDRHVMGGTDEDGWQYGTGNFWSNFSSSSSGAYVRRRLWMRTLIRGANK